MHKLATSQQKQKRLTAQKQITALFLLKLDFLTNMYIQQIGSREKMEEYFNKTSAQIRDR